MTRRIVLHIGTPKAGSTFLQRALLRNRARLGAHGVAYPHPGHAHPGNAGDLARLDEARFDALFEDGARVAVLSHEDLFARPADGHALARLAQRAGVVVQRLCFLRPWSEFCAGDFSQHLKQHFERYLAARRAFDGLTFEAMAARRAADLAPARSLAGWNAVLGGPPAILAPHRAIRPVVEAALGVPGLDWAMPRHLANPSLRLCDCEAVAAMIDDPAVPAEAVRQAFRDAHHRTADPDPARSPARMAAIEALFARHDAALLADHGFDNRRREDARASA